MPCRAAADRRELRHRGRQATLSRGSIGSIGPERKVELLRAWLERRCSAALVADAIAHMARVTECIDHYGDPAVKRLRSTGRVLILADPPAEAHSPAQAAARQALDGLVRSVAKELRGGSTAMVMSPAYSR